MERCVFCGSTRRSNPNLRFFGIPREPGLKRIQWLYVLGDKDIAQKDRVCAIHFRQGKPSNDPSHEDFIPHLNLNREEPAESTLQYLESLDSIKDVNLKVKKREKPSILRKRTAEDKNANSKKRNTTCNTSTSSNLIPIPTSLMKAIELKHGQEVIIKQYKKISRVFQQ